jgi:hypothetical protein
MTRMTRLRWDDLLQLLAGLAGAAAIVKLYWLTGETTDGDTIGAAIRHYGIIYAVVFKLLVPSGAIAGCLFFAYRAVVDKPKAVRVTPNVKHINGLPYISWEQTAGSTETLAQRSTSEFYVSFVALMLIGGASGFFLSKPETVFQNTLIGIFVGLLLGGQGLGQFNKELTQHEKSKPVTREERCKVFVEEADSGLMLVVARGPGDCESLPIVDRVPLDSFSNFEEGSHRQWFRDRVGNAELVDWGVIVLQTRSGDVISIAESVDAQYELTKLLGLLQTHIVEPRDQLIERFSRSKLPPAHEPAVKAPASSTGVPSRRF